MSDRVAADASELDWSKWSERFDRFDAAKDWIAYKAGYKYQLHQDYSLFIPITPDRDISSDFICLQTDGRLTIKKGYAWDGVWSCNRHQGLHAGFSGA